MGIKIIKCVHHGVVPSKTNRISYWDAFIVEAALRCRVSVLYTQDLHRGTRYGTLELHNPSSPDPMNDFVDLVQIVTAATADAYARGNSWLACRAGCSQCCIGVFPIRRQDADRLREGLSTLTLTDPVRAARIRARVAAALTRLDPWFPGDLVTGSLSDSYEDAILFEEFANDEPCPVLDLDHGTCDLYESRPILCRTFGPPMRTEEGNLATCELCFVGADTEEIARCELDPTIPALEEASNDAYDETTGQSGETLIAYALRGC